MRFSIILFIIITLTAVYFQSSRELHIPGPAFAGQIESFSNPNNHSAPNPDGTGQSFRSGPADTDSSYKLLADTIRPTNKTGLTTIGSEKCYNTNYQSKIELVGNLAQRTNNYRHQYPDTCMGTRQEMILGFYEPKPLA
jgi:hypothetical protein